MWWAIYSDASSEGGDGGAAGGGHALSDGGSGGGRNSPATLPALDFESSQAVVAHVQVRAAVVHDVKAVALAPMR